MKITLGYLETISGIFQPIADQFQQLAAQITSGWIKEHKGDGTHADVVADSLDTPRITTTGTVLQLDKGLRFMRGPWYLGADGDPAVPIIIIQPAQLTANQNDWNPQALANALVVEVTTDAARTITGIERSIKRRRLLALINRGSFTITLANEDAGSTAVNRFALPQGRNVFIYSGGGVWLYYDIESERWRVFSLVPNSPSDDLTAYKTADESITNSTTLQDDNHMTVSVLASTNYNIKCYGFWTTAGAVAGIRVALSGTAGVTSLKGQITIFDDATNAMAGFARVTAFGTSVGAGLTGDNSFLIEGSIEVSTAGTVLVQWAQNTADAANATTVQRNSYLELVRVQ